MPKPKLELSFRYLTAVQARKRLNLTRWQFDCRIERGVFPKPTFIDNTGKQYVRYFDENWVKIAQAILDNSVQADSK